MKTMSSAGGIIVLTLWVATLHLGAAVPADPADPPSVIPTGVQDAITAPAPEPGLLLNVHGAPLEQLLDYIASAAGYTVHVRSNVQLTGTVQAWNYQPLSQAEALDLLNQILDDHGLTALQEERTLTIIRRQDAPFETPIRLGNNAADIRKDAVMVTQIIPVRTLNVTELLKILPPMLPNDTRLSANESAHSLLMTDTQANIRRVVEIVRALDSISSSVNSLRVLPLKYGDATTVAALIKELFPSQDAARSGGAGAANPGIRRTSFGARGAPGNAAAAASSTEGQTPVSRVAAVADEHGNSVIVSAPDDLMQTIEDLVNTLDHPVQAITEVRTFQLTNADPVEMADLLSSLYPDENISADSSAAPILVASQGVGGAPNGRARQGTSGAVSDPGDHMKKLGSVLAVPDRRTSTLVVSAARDLMPQIDELLNRLDADPANRQSIHIVQLQYADAADVQQIIQSLFPSASSAATPSTSAIETRRLALQQQQITAASTTGSSAAPGSPRSSTP